MSRSVTKQSTVSLAAYTQSRTPEVVHFHPLAACVCCQLGA